mmetsp:Transcript_40976/g.92219  ORF Transcript_40976/g.92219 Transcript_40976/m.92219 type:complete len:310 (-) Transcript_40976:384-1313(-)
MSRAPLFATLATKGFHLECFVHQENPGQGPVLEEDPVGRFHREPLGQHRGAVQGVAQGEPEAVPRLLGGARRALKADEEQSAELKVPVPERFEPPVGNGVGLDEVGEVLPRLLLVCLEVGQQGGRPKDRRRDARVVRGARHHLRERLEGSAEIARRELGIRALNLTARVVAVLRVSEGVFEQVTRLEHHLPPVLAAVHEPVASQTHGPPKRHFRHGELAQEGARVGLGEDAHLGLLEQSPGLADLELAREQRRQRDHRRAVAGPLPQPLLKELLRLSLVRGPIIRGRGKLGAVHAECGRGRERAHGVGE